MPNEQVKGTLLAVGTTAASTALLVGGIIGIHNTYESATGVDPSTVIDFRAKQASDAAAGGTDRRVQRSLPCHARGLHDRRSIRELDDRRAR